eukprot:5809888-Karenia_brevis.AAC.1
MMKTVPAAPGPDGISIALWKAAPEQFRMSIYDVYLALLGGAHPHKDFNHALMIFILKNGE